MVKTATDWDIDKSRVETDHNLVSVIITNPKAPFIGRGRWTLPMFLLKDKEFKKNAIELSIKLQKDLEDLTERSETNNPQTDTKKISKKWPLPEPKQQSQQQKG